MTDLHSSLALHLALTLCALCYHCSTVEKPHRMRRLSSRQAVQEGQQVCGTGCHHNTSEWLGRMSKCRSRGALILSWVLHLHCSTFLKQGCIGLRHKHPVQLGGGVYFVVCLILFVAKDESDKRNYKDPPPLPQTIVFITAGTTSSWHPCVFGIVQAEGFYSTHRLTIPNHDLSLGLMMTLL